MQQALVHHHGQRKVLEPHTHASHEIKGQTLAITAMGLKNHVGTSAVGHFAVADLPLELLQIQQSHPRSLKIKEHQLVAALVLLPPVGIAGDFKPRPRSVQTMVLAGKDGHGGVGRVVNNRRVCARDADKHLANRCRGGRVIGQAIQHLASAGKQVLLLALDAEICTGLLISAQQEAGQRQGHQTVGVQVQFVAQSE